MKVTRTDKETGEKNTRTVEQAKEVLEGCGYYKCGTIDQNVAENPDGFSLHSDWACFSFERMTDGRH